MSATRTAGIRAALLSVPLVIASVGTAVAPADAASFPPVKSLTCDGKGVDPGAQVRYRTETLVHAPLRTVWKLQTDVERWPSWQASVTTAERLDHGPLRNGSAFRWTTPVPPNPTPATGLDITSTVSHLRHGSCIRWTGPAVGEGLRIDGVHVCNFIATGDGVLVRTEETHTGAQVDADVPVATGLLRQGLEAWLLDLRTAAEARTHGPRH
jgi:uncharacterized membrane protein